MPSCKPERRIASSRLAHSLRSRAFSAWSEGPGIGDVQVGLVAGTRSACTGPWATGHAGLACNCQSEQGQSRHQQDGHRHIRMAMPLSVYHGNAHGHRPNHADDGWINQLHDRINAQRSCRRMEKSPAPTPATAAPACSWSWRTPIPRSDGRTWCGASTRGARTG